MADPGDALVEQVDRLLADDDADRARRYPGPRPGRQPVHTVYVPADQFHAGTVAMWGQQALTALHDHGPLPDVADEVTALVLAKLGREPVEDLRIDFEDGYGQHPDEDDHARAAASAVAAAVAAGDWPANYGIRMKSLESATRRRGVRTLQLFLAELVAHGPLPAGFRVTLPKVTSVRQVEAMVLVCQTIEQHLGLPALDLELQIETPQAVLGADGTALVARLLHAADGRCLGLHYGTYDYSAALGIAAAWQSMAHPVADHAKAVMQLAAAGTGAVVSDGSTNVLPVGTTAQVQAAWALHAGLVRRSLERGVYQGWDLHPAQLPSRFAATFGFYREGLAASAQRLRAYLDKADSGILDEPATARALAGYLLRAAYCGAVSGDELTAATQLDIEALQRLSRS